MRGAHFADDRSAVNETSLFSKFQVFTAVFLTMQVFRDVMSCRLAS